MFENRNGEMDMYRKLRQGMVLCLVWVVIMLTACDAGLAGGQETADGETYSDGQIMVIVATERNRYRELYTDQIWEVEVDGNGTTFQTYLLNEIRDFITELKMMNLLADEKGVRLTGQEKEQMQELAHQYYETLTEEDLQYIGAGEEEIERLYEQYDRANKLVEELTKDVNLEISDSEARVITVQEIIVSDEETAKQLHEMVMAEGADFASLARSYSEEETVERQVGRGESEKDYEDIVFWLEEGQISDVIEQDGRYYVVKVIDDYDEEATQERKDRLALQRKNQAFRRIYDEFAVRSQAEIESRIWDGSVIHEGEDSTTTAFFTMYQEYRNP
ncbi:MAG: peptidylprolyl isomerase [Clostridiales bacterium]|nr:peptidylprolyl isomerase [Clostridiales bacterium]